VASKWTPAWISLLVVIIVGVVSLVVVARSFLVGDFGLDRHMLELTKRARIELANAKTDGERCFPLADIAKDDINRGKIAEARLYATELLAMAARHKPAPNGQDSHYGVAVHDGNMVMGRIALIDHKKEEAKQYLLKAGMTPGGPSLDSFGPNMALAKDLIEAGERDTVIEYFHECLRFWGDHKDTLDDWEATVKSGGTPDFGGNLYY